MRAATLDTMTHSAPRPLAVVTGGCGFVGRHLVKQLIREGSDVWIIDNLSTGIAPVKWLSKEELVRIMFTNDDAINVFSQQRDVPRAGMAYFEEVYHLASVVGGRAVIEGDPMAVAIDLAIDALFFRWVVANKERIGRVLYASSSAAYPVHLQGKETALALREDYIQFNEQLGMPDLTYGWSKLTGEYLSRIAAERYGVSVACVRPFSGYGGDQDTSYPIPAIARRVAAYEDPLVVWGTGEQGRDFVHIDDCITAMRRAITTITDGSAVNIGSGTLTTFLEVAALFAELAGYSPTIQPLIDKPVGVQSRYSDPREMRKVLAWSPTISLQEGFARVLAEQQTLLEKEQALTIA